MNLKKYKVLIILFSGILFCSVNHAQEIYENPETENQTTLKKTRLPFFMDDIMLVGSINQSGVFFSSNYRNLGYQTAFTVGAEKYLPMPRILFISTGLHYSQRNLRHKVNNVIFTNHYIDIPAFFSFEIPELKSIDFRFLVGTHISFKLKTNQINEYTSDNLNNHEIIKYSPSDFNLFDIGWTFGVSAEYKNILFRLRSYIGTTNIIKGDPGSMNSINLDIGYFIFRPFRK
jgi:hypothetical protein